MVREEHMVIVKLLDCLSKFHFALHLLIDMQVLIQSKYSITLFMSYQTFQK